MNKRCAMAAQVLWVSTIFAQANDYEAISLRNPFDLLSPQPVVETNAPITQAKPSVELTLNGIADFSARKWALLTRVEAGKQARSFTLGEGQGVEDLQVLAIDAKTSSVKVRQDGLEVMLTFRAPGAGNVEEDARRHVQASQKFVDEHTRAHAEREKREALRREKERARERAVIEPLRMSPPAD